MLDTNSTFDKLAGYLAFMFAGLGIYLFRKAADTATGDRGRALGSARRR